MNKTILCISPICGKQIAVPEGAVQVVCSECNTLHFIADSELIDASNQKDDFAGMEDMGAADMDLSALDLDSESELNELQVKDEAQGLQPTLQDEGTETEIETAPLNHTEEAPKVVMDQEFGYLVTNTGEHLPLKLGLNVIGRSNADLIISDKTVSRKHCVIEATSDESSKVTFVIYDIGHTEGAPSTNGVYLSGRTIRLQDYERVPLKDGMTIEVGSVHLDFLVKTKTVPD